MPFINEYIPAEDVEKYKLKEIDDIFLGTRARDWTIDRERDIYLRNVDSGRDEFRSQTFWTFYWKGSPLTLRLDLLEGRGGAGEPGWSHWLLVDLNGSHGLPDSLKAYRQEVLADLKEALVAYKGAGVFSANTDYSVTLDVAEGCIL